jgi:PAS domain-containing protein
VPAQLLPDLERTGIGSGESAMTYEGKTREELIRELLELQNRLDRLVEEQAARDLQAADEVEVGPPVTLLRDSFFELEMAPRPLLVDEESTESIELKTLFTRDVSSSGSFEVRGGIWASTFGKVIQALPIPAFLVDKNLKVTVANQACGRWTPNYERIQGQPYASLLGGPSAAERAQSLLERVFSDRRPRFGEGSLKIDSVVVWARMTFRSIRIMEERFVFVLVEDLTREKVQLHENEMLRRELEKRVEQRTAELRRTNDDLRNEVEERKRAEREREKVIVQLQQALAQVKKLSGLLPICASCKKIRDDKGYWQQIEAYIRDHSEAEFSHGLCPECAKKLYPDFV